MTVFPTPGSPTRAGLFLCFRQSTSMICSISASRPMTGSESVHFSSISIPNCSKSLMSCLSPSGMISEQSRAVSAPHSKSISAAVVFPSTQTAHSSRRRLRTSEVCNAAPMIRSAPSDKPCTRGVPRSPIPRSCTAARYRRSVSAPYLQRMSRHSGSMLSASKRCSLPTKQWPISRATAPAFRRARAQCLSNPVRFMIFRPPFPGKSFPNPPFFILIKNV